MLNSDSKIAVLGLGIEGKDILYYLKKRNFKDVTVFDRKKRSDLDLKDVDTKSVKVVAGPGYLKNGLKNFQIIFRSPGFYRYLPEIVEAEANGAVITSNIKLFFEKYKGVTIGVTGTKGKGTTSTLIYEILKNSGKKVYLSGNIGTPPLSIIGREAVTDICVLELSSFQLIDLELSPKIAVVLNITSDHMDWHKNQREYVKAKKNIVRFQDTRDQKVLNFDYRSSRFFENLSPSRTLFFSKKTKVKGVYVKDGVINSNVSGKEVKIGNTNDLLLRGRHNWENVCAAICASELAGAKTESIRKTVFSFKGLEHRLELVKELNGVKYYNDSFSTNPQTTIAAVNSFSEPVTLILGGYDKGLDFTKMIKHICRKRNVKNIVLIGDVENKLYRLLKKYSFSNLIVKMGKQNMPVIVSECKKLTGEGGIILLSPACASFDMFKSYKDRGQQFRYVVQKLN